VARSGSSKRKKNLNKQRVQRTSVANKATPKRRDAGELRQIWLIIVQPRNSPIGARDMSNPSQESARSLRRIALEAGAKEFGSTIGWVIAHSAWLLLVLAVLFVLRTW
jgi:hypothetical protein